MTKINKKQLDSKDLINNKYDNFKDIGILEAWLFCLILVLFAFSTYFMLKLVLNFMFELLIKLIG